MNDYQKAKEQLRESYLVSASAGTGKTRVLVERYINILLRNPADLEGIVAITFTEKAAAEMKARIRQLIRRMDDPALDTPAILDRLNMAPISTIHSFCMRILQEQIQATGLDPQFRVIDAIEESLLRKETLEIFLHQNLHAVDSPIQTLIRHFDLYQVREMLDSVWQKRADWLFILEENSQQSATEIIQDHKEKHHDYTLSVLRQTFGSPEAQGTLKLLSSYQARDPDDSLQRAKTTILKVVRQIEAGQIPAELWDNSLHQAFSLKNLGQKGNWGDELEDLRAAFRFLHDLWLATRVRLFPFNEELESQNAVLLLAFSDLVRNYLSEE
jgi:ATP-dependent helicase/nuclease subunit A